MTPSYKSKLDHLVGDDNNVMIGILIAFLYF